MTDEYPRVPVKYVTTYNDETLPETFDADTEINYIEISDVDSERGITNSTTVKFAEAPSRARRKVRANDVLVSTVRTYLRAIASAGRDHNGFIASTGFCVLRPTKIHPRYLKYAASSPEFVEGVIARSTGISYPAINATDLVRLPIPVPSGDKQRDIANFLDCETAQIDALISRQERLIELLGEKRQIIITQAVTKGLDPSAPTKPSGVPWVGDIPSHWTVPQLGMHAKVGNGSTPNRDNVEYWSGGDIPWLNSSHVNRDEIIDADQFISEAATTACHLPLVGAGSLLVGLTGQGRTRGMTSILRFPATINQHVAYVTPEPSAWNPEYLLWFLRSSYERLRELSNENGSTKGALTCNAIKKLNIALPPPSEQYAIAANITQQLAGLDRIVAASRATIELLRERRAALISAAVTGDMQVK